MPYTHTHTPDIPVICVDPISQVKFLDSGLTEHHTPGKYLERQPLWKGREEMGSLLQPLMMLQRVLEWRNPF